MKILLVDGGNQGHYKEYRDALIRNINAEIVLVIPEELNINEGEDYKGEGIRNIVNISYIPEFSYQGVNFKKYLSAMAKLRKIVQKEKPDIVHFLVGDYLKQYGGLFIRSFGECKVIATYHHVGIPGDSAIYRAYSKISLRLVSKKLHLIVVHSEYLKNALIYYGVNNSRVVQYPSFAAEKDVKVNEKDYKEKQVSDAKIILALGGTRYDKGIDILLDALKKVNSPFHLVIAGREQYFKKNELAHMAEPFLDKVDFILKYLTQGEMIYWLKKCDILVVPYRRIFNGVSGPMTDAAYFHKTVIGPDSGELGNTIQTYHLGYVFRTEDDDSLASVIDKALIQNFRYDEKAVAYSSQLDVSVFACHYNKIYNEVFFEGRV